MIKIRAKFGNEVIGMGVEELQGPLLLRTTGRSTFRTKKVINVVNVIAVGGKLLVIGEGIQGKECEMISFRQPDLTSLPYVDI